MTLSACQQANQRGYFSAPQLRLNISELQEALRSRKLSEFDLLQIGQRYFWAFDAVKRLFPHARDPRSPTMAKSVSPQEYIAKRKPKCGHLVAPLCGCDSRVPLNQMYLSDWAKSRGVTRQKALGWMRRGVLGEAIFKSKPKAGLYLTNVSVADRYFEQLSNQGEFETTQHIAHDHGEAIEVMPENLVQPKIVAAQYQTNIETVNKWCRKGYVSARRRGARGWLIDMSSTKTTAWLEGLSQRKEKMATIALGRTFGRVPNGHNT